MNWLGGVLVSIGSFLAIINWISALFLHVLTIILAYQVSGIFAAVVSLVLPGISTIYWFVFMWWKTGEAFNSQYGHWVGVFLLYLAISVALMLAGSALQERKNR
jgi:hypothetical protein